MSVIEHSEIDAHAWQRPVISQDRKSWNLREITHAAPIHTHPSRALPALRYRAGFCASRAGTVRS